MMDRLISILYDPHRSLPEEQEFYYQAIEEIESEALSSQIYYLLKEQNKLEKTPFFFQVRLKQKAQEVLNLNLFIKSQETNLFKRFEELQIEAIPLKGVCFAEMYFGHLGARKTTDIDLLIKERDFNKIQEIVKQSGFTVEEERIPGHFHCSFSKAVPGFPVPLTVEVHWNILKERTSKLDIKSFWQEAVNMEGYQYIKHLSGYHAFYFICLHGWRHNLDSKKHSFDIIQLIKVLKNDLDYNRLYQETIKHQTSKRISRTLSSIYLHFPVINSMLPLPGYLSVDRRKRLSGGSTSYIDFFSYQFFSYDCYKHSVTEMINWLIPNSFELAAELQADKKEDNYFFNLIRLYKQRSRSFIKTNISS